MRIRLEAVLQALPAVCRGISLKEKLSNYLLVAVLQALLAVCRGIKKMGIKFSISQAAKILGITTDAIRLYEKEGLIHPKRDEQNYYRYYDWEQLRLLMFIAFYRKLDVSIPETKRLLTSSTFDDISNTFNSLIEHNRRQIDLIQTRIERLAFFSNTLKELSGSIGIFSLGMMPRGYKMFEQVNADTEHKKMKELLSSPLLSFGNISYMNYFNEHGPTQRYLFYIIWEDLINVAPLEKPVSEYPVLESCECICTSTTGSENGIVDIDMKKLNDFCHANNCEHQGYYYTFYAYSVPDGDKIIDYHKVYFPIKM